MESESEVLGVARKLAKYALHPFKFKYFEKVHFFCHMVPKEWTTHLGSQGILGVKYDNYGWNVWSNFIDWKT
jgi:hypothetical protein